jgi:hypothetical protein
MAYINLTGDSDGDLHTAAMHNAKFGAIASVLNGNIDEDNLKYPNSLITWQVNAAAMHCVVSSTGGQATYGASVLSTSSSTVGTLSAGNITTAPSVTSGQHNVLITSFRKVPAAMTHVATSAIVVQDPSFTGTAANSTLRFQEADALLGTYHDIATGPFLPDAASVVTPTEVTMTYSQTNMAANKYFRIVYTNGYTWAGQILPTFVITTTWKVAHVA